MQKQNPVIKNYIMLPKPLVLKEKPSMDSYKIFIIIQESEIKTN